MSTPPVHPDNENNPLADAVCIGTMLALFALVVVGMLRLVGWL